MRFVLSCIALLAFFAPAVAQPKLPNLPPNLLAPTDPLSPEAERKQFVVPPGFEVQLIASEPDIQKPMQMAFDAKGRMWVTTSYHYPFASAGKPTDKVFVLSDFDPKTGKAGKVQTFTSDLNIPIGILPLPDCKSVLVSSVGEIRKYKIAEKDGMLKSDGFEVLFSGFGQRDTHGMYNSYTLMPDGWVYSCHGFNNDSTVKDRSGNTIKMHSGNTFRFRPDGSKIEVWTRGQVNPFGMAVDPWFNLYTADCHSKPITQLIPGAYYDSFGKPHDGLGFAPHVTAHPHKSTGLCGLVWYDADHFPKEYLGTMLLGDVVSNCISADRIDWKGASPVAKELPDFMTSKDRWFRPVDIKLGPDGALYVADFYNKIIGHYEVDLKDPRRDKDRGRLWRIVWKGLKDPLPAPKFHRADFTKATDDELFDDLFHPNLTVRFLAGHQLRLRVIEGKNLTTGDGIFEKLTKNLDRAAAVVAWVMSIDEVGKNPPKVKDYQTFVDYAKDPKNGFKPEHITGHLVRALASREMWGDEERALLLDIFKSFDSIHQTRACVEAVIAHPHADFVKPVLAVLKKCAPDDTHLRMAAKVALRNCLRDAEAWPDSDDAIFVEMATAIPNAKSAKYLLARLTAKTIPADKLNASVEHAARYGAIANDGKLFAYLEQSQSFDALAALVRGVQARGPKLEAELTKNLLLREGLTFEGVNTGGAPVLKPAEVQQVLWGLRTYKALAVVGDRDSLKNGASVASYLEALASAPKAPDEVRIGSVEVLLAYAPVEGLKAVRKLLAGEAAPESVRTGVILVAAASGLPGVQAEARDALKTVPYRVAVPVGLGLASTPVGADLLLEAVKHGKAPARLLQEKAIVERLRAQKIANFDKVLADLTKNLPPADQRIANLLKTRATAFAAAKPDKVEGAKLFTKHCAACHRVGDMGGKIAPQLDGIGVRGTERLLEDVLDPNRNVDQAFRARSIALTNDKTLTALMLRVEGKVLVVADLEGKEQRIPLDEIATNRETMLSAMPANLADTIPETDLYHILAYLLDQRAKEPKKKE